MNVAGGRVEDAGSTGEQAGSATEQKAGERSAGHAQATEHLVQLCSVTPDRRPGSAGNLAATEYVAAQLLELGWEPEMQWFDCLDWESEDSQVRVDGRAWEVVPSPYSTGASGSGPLIAAASKDELAACRASGAVLVLHGSLTRQPLTPRGYPFYSSAEDDEVLELIESAEPRAVIAITGRYPELCGAMDPFPFIEDGSSRVPAAAVGPDVGRHLLAHVGQLATVDLRASRRPARAANVLARRGPQDRRVTVVAHVDSKPGTPGALDNAAGVVALLMVARGLADEPFDGEVGVELLAVNGEDSYAAPGEVAYLEQARLDEVLLAINFDAVGLPKGPTAWSLYECPSELESLLRRELVDRPGLVEGPPWFQSDHAIFAMHGRPALAMTSADITTALASVAHAPSDTPDRVDIGAVHAAAGAVAAVVRAAIDVDWRTDRLR